MKKALLAVLVFCIMQALSGIVLAVPMMGTSSTAPSMFTIIGLALIVSGIATFLICWKGLRVIEFPQTFNTKDINWKWALVAIVGAFSGVFAGDILSEIASLPNLMEKTFEGMVNNVWGVLAIAIIGPIVEELVFREGICGHLIRTGSSPWKAIWVSAILFGIIHFNPAQVPFAILMGVILGVIYAKTGNIVVTSIIHIINNSFAVVQYWSLGEKAKDFSLTEWMGGNAVAGACVIVGFAVCFYLLRRFWEADTAVKADEIGVYDKG